MSGQSSCASWFLSDGLLFIWIRIEADRTDHVVEAERALARAAMSTISSSQRTTTRSSKITAPRIVAISATTMNGSFDPRSPLTRRVVRHNAVRSTIATEAGPHPHSPRSASRIVLPSSNIRA
jgi:hypothetical protein